MGKKRIPTGINYSVLLKVRAGEDDFGPVVVGIHMHRACLDLLGNAFGEPMINGENSRLVRGLTDAGKNLLDRYEQRANKPSAAR